MDRIRTHVFLSFANTDVDLVRRLATRLEAEGLAAWTGDEKLVPGTPDWEQAVRDAIDASFAVVLVASPAAARSVYVRGEIGIAGAHQLPLFAVWVQGESWVDCAPLMLASSQFVDCRGEEFERGTSRLADVLRPLAQRAVPNHFPRSPLDLIPPSCLSISLPPTTHAGPDAPGAIVKSGAYHSLETLLDELYANYLRDHYEPLTYGKRWMLVEARPDAFGFVVAPWSWLLSVPIDRQWVRGQSPSDCHLLPGTSWQVTVPPADGYGLALSDARVLHALRTTAKSDLGLRQDGYLAFRRFADVDAAAFPCTAVCRGRSRFWRDDEGGPQVALVQMKQVPEDELNWYLSYRVP